jgi:hypothetical protein
MENVFHAETRHFIQPGVTNFLILLGGLRMVGETTIAVRRSARAVACRFGSDANQFGQSGTYGEWGAYGESGLTECDGWISF